VTEGHRELRGLFLTGMSHAACTGGGAPLIYANRAYGVPQRLPQQYVL
jgi:hypothetical protein